MVNDGTVIEDFCGTGWFVDSGTFKECNDDTWKKDKIWKKSGSGFMLAGHDGYLYKIQETKPFLAVFKFLLKN